MSRGVCTNLPAACSQAAARAVLPCPDQDTRCPTCGAALLPVGGGAPVGRGAGAVRWAASSLAVVLALGAGWNWWSSEAAVDRAEPVATVVPVSPAVLAVAQATSALESEPPGVGTPNVFALHGMDALGPLLGAELVEAFLTQEGHVEVHRSLPDPHGAVLVSARRPGGLRQDIRLAFDGGSAAPNDASLRRISSTSGTDLKDNQILVGMDALAVVVHPDNPMDRISLGQLRDLLSGRVVDGARLGGTAGPVRVNVRSASSDNWTLLLHQVIGSASAGADLQHHETDTALVQAVAADAHALGVVPLSAVGAVEGTKVLAVVDSFGSVWKPTPEAVATERYPLTHRLVVQMPAASSPVALRYAQFLAGPAAQARLRSSGLASASPVLIDQTGTGPVSVGAAVKLPKDYLALTRGAQLLTGRIGFAAESAELDAVAHVDVDRLARQLKEQAAAKPVSVVVLGVANDPGGFCFNRSLSDKRAASVAEALTAQGVKVRVVRGVGRFAAAPAGGADDAARDRRVEVWVSDAPVHQPAAFRLPLRSV
jgi:phosphate transport system substrate-binding protein